jgi:hypothetical protein
MSHCSQLLSTSFSRSQILLMRVPLSDFITILKPQLLKLTFITRFEHTHFGETHLDNSNIVLDQMFYNFKVQASYSGGTVTKNICDVSHFSLALSWISLQLVCLTFLWYSWRSTKIFIHVLSSQKIIHLVLFWALSLYIHPYFV